MFSEPHIGDLLSSPDHLSTLQFVTCHKPPWTIGCVCGALLHPSFCRKFLHCAFCPFWLCPLNQTLSFSLQRILSQLFSHMQSYTMLSPKPARATLSILFFTLGFLPEFAKTCILQYTLCLPKITFSWFAFFFPFSLFLKITIDNIAMYKTAFTVLLYKQ